MGNLQKNLDMLSYHSDELKELAWAFSRVGNEKIANKLDLIAESIFNSVKEIGEINRNHTSELYKQSQQASANVLSAALAGIKIGEKDNKD